MRGFTVIVDIATLDENRDLEKNPLPCGVEKQFLDKEILDAADYYRACVNYFTAALRWDPEYHQCQIVIQLWHDLRNVGREVLS